MSGPIVLVQPAGKIIRTLLVLCTVAAALCLVTLYRHSGTGLSIFVGFCFGFNGGTAFTVWLCKRRDFFA